MCSFSFVHCIVLLQFTASDYHFNIFKLFVKQKYAYDDQHTTRCYAVWNDKHIEQTPSYCFAYTKAGLGLPTSYVEVLRSMSLHGRWLSNLLMLMEMFIITVKINIRKNEWGITNGQCRITRNIGYTRHNTKTNKYIWKIYLCGEKIKKYYFYLNEYLTDKDQQPFFAASYTNFLHFPFKKQGILH